MADTNRKIELSFNDGDLIPDTYYRIVDKDGQIIAGRVARPISSGGAGEVYRALYKDKMARAVKFLNPRSDIPAAIHLFERSFGTEIEHLSKITYMHISKIMDFGELKVADQVVPYYIMDYIDGQQLDHVWQDPDCKGDTFLKLLDEVLDALEYLHSKGIMHGDVKEGNILVRKHHHNNSFSATLVDLGTAKIVDYSQLDMTESENLSEITYLSSTTRITPEPWQPYLNQWITRDKVASMHPHKDLFAFGKLIERALSQPEFIEHGLRELDNAVITEIMERLLRDRGPFHYQSVSQLRRDWKKLASGYLSPVGIPELSLAGNMKRAVTTPLGRVSFTERLSKIVNHSLFQRLRLIPQLEFVYLVTPGARHSRLLHSVTNFDVARQYISHLLNDAAFRLMVEPAEIEATLLLALLQDIGHFPLSHMFEDAITKSSIPKAADLFENFVSSNGDFASLIQESYFASAQRAGDQKPQMLHQLLLDNFSHECLSALRLIRKPKEPNHRVLQGVISSMIGVDKVAYLLLDSTLTGVRYGLGLDLDALLSSLRTPLLSDLDASNTSAIALADKGLPAAEAIVLARYWMWKRVYWQHTNRSIMAMVKFVISTLLENKILDFRDYFNDTLFETEVEAARRLAHIFDNAVKNGQISERVKNPLYGILDGNRVIYKRLLTLSNVPHSFEEDLYDKIRQARLNWKQVSHITSELTQVVGSLLGQHLPEGSILLDLPIRGREKMEGQVLIYPHRDSPRGNNLLQISPLLGNKTVQTAFNNYVTKYRVFIHPAVREDLDRQLKLGKAYEQVRSVFFSWVNSI